MTRQASGARRCIGSVAGALARSGRVSLCVLPERCWRLGARKPRALEIPGSRGTGLAGGLVLVRIARIVCGGTGARPLGAGLRAAHRRRPPPQSPTRSGPWTPFGLGPEVRAALQKDGACWGAQCLLRRREAATLGDGLGSSPSLPARGRTDPRRRRCTAERPIEAGITNCGSSGQGRAWRRRGLRGKGKACGQEPHSDRIRAFHDQTAPAGTRESGPEGPTEDGAGGWRAA